MKPNECEICGMELWSGEAFNVFTFDCYEVFKDCKSKLIDMMDMFVEKGEINYGKD